MFAFLQCVGEALVNKGLRGLMGAVPLGQQLYDIGADAIARYRQRQREKSLAAGLEEVIQAEADDIREDIARIKEEIAGNQPPEVREQLELYLSQIPSVARQSFRRAEDLTGTTVPANLHLEDPVHLSTILPQRTPRFRVGERVPHAQSWILARLLGVGGFGEVWLAKHGFITDRRQAFKFCLDPAAQKRLLTHESGVVQRVMEASHEVRPDQHGIVPLLDAYLDGDTPWLAYEYVEGGDLTGLVRQWQNLDAEKRAKCALNTFKQLAAIVGRLHRLSTPIIHRDLKPANVLVRRTETGDILRVTDFGISHVVAESMIRNATISTPQMSLGESFRGAHTPIYASPEQKKGSPASARDDVHALGVMAYQMILVVLTSERPSGSKWKRRLSAFLPEEVLELLENCWEEDPEDRPANGLEIVERLTGSSDTGPKNEREQATTPSRSARHTNPKRGDIITGAMGMKFAFIPRGTFWMSEGVKNAQRKVTIEEDFYMGIYQVTQGEWIELMGSNPSWFRRDGFDAEKLKDISDEDLLRFPVENVSWDDVQEFLKQLSTKEEKHGLLYRLPTEAEWEYSCRSGLTSKEDCDYDFYFSEPTNDLSSEQANFNGNHPVGQAPKSKFLERPTVVGSYEPNALGIHDMHGNVREWCQNGLGQSRFIRGGCWSDYGSSCQAANYRKEDRWIDNGFQGFRLVCTFTDESDTVGK